MRTSLMAPAIVAAATTLVGASVAGCSGNSKTSTATSGSVASTTSHSSPSAPAQAQHNDYARLLIRAEDINAPETFTATAPTRNPDGKQGVTTTFSNEDGSHVIIDTILIMTDPAAAAAARDAAKATLPASTTGTPVPANIGTGGTSVSGESPDGSKGVTVLRFTEGRAFATLEFDGPVSSLAPPDFVTDVGHKQAAAIKSGLA